MYIKYIYKKGQVLKEAPPNQLQTHLFGGTPQFVCEFVLFLLHSYSSITNSYWAGTEGRPIRVICSFQTYFSCCNNFPYKPNSYYKFLSLVMVLYFLYKMINRILGVHI